MAKILVIIIIAEEDQALEDLAEAFLAAEVVFLEVDWAFLEVLEADNIIDKDLLDLLDNKG